MKKPLHGSITLPGSKSESNRALMIAAYGGFRLQAKGLSKANDTVLLRRLLRQIAKAKKGKGCLLDAEDAGTVSRFLMTLLATTECSWVLTGSDRLRQRPMAALIDGLCQLGADIQCIDAEGFLPVRIQGKALRGGRVIMDGSQSSQFATSLLLAAPTWPNGLSLTLTGQQASMPYLRMTMEMMRHFGASVIQQGDTITVDPKPYQSVSFTVEPDWSAASYWYELAALASKFDLRLKGLHLDSMQGDARVATLFKAFGVDTLEDPKGLRIVVKEGAKERLQKAPLVFDFFDTPDLFPAVLATCLALNCPATFRGIQNLSLKESDRVLAMLTELSKIYTFINIGNSDEIIIEKSSLSDAVTNGIGVEVDTHLDHRIAMAVAPITKFFSNVALDHPEVVSKSYPSYWDDFQRFEILNKIIY